MLVRNYYMSFSLSLSLSLSLSSASEAITRTVTQMSRVEYTITFSLDNPQSTGKRIFQRKGLLDVPDHRIEFDLNFVL
jgi:hypothetical protein